VIDAGANLGRFGLAMTQRHDCSVLAIEPSADNFELIAVETKIQKIKVALAGRDGICQLKTDADCTANRVVALPDGKGFESFETVECLTLESVIARAGWNGSALIDLIKVDIEGMEWEVFASASDNLLIRCMQITVEFHDFAGLAPHSNATWQIYMRLRSLGFWELEDPVRGPYNVLFVNRRAQLSPLHKAMFGLCEMATFTSRKWGRVTQLLGITNANG